MKRALAIAVSGLIAFLSTWGCAANSESRRYSRQQAQDTLSRLEAPGLVIGEFKLAPDPVLDGDTVKVEGLDTTLRLLGIDTEETYKTRDDRRAATADFDTYLRKKRGDSQRPVKAATPLGEEAKRWAKTFFSGVTRVRLERDHPKEIRGVYNRYLTYILVEKNGVWFNYNIECVRAGMSPYFTKYGYSRRFHDQFKVAERQARKASRGIWDASKQRYPDYEQRKRWWDARADFIHAFEREAKGRDDYIPLTRWDSLRRLDEREGREVVLLATVGKVRHGQKGPSKVFLSRRRDSSFPIVFFDKDVMGNTGIANAQGEFVRVRGKVTRYFNKYRKKDELQIVVSRPNQVEVSRVPQFSESSAETASPVNVSKKD